MPNEKIKTDSDKYVLENSISSAQLIKKPSGLRLKLSSASASANQARGYYRLL